MAAQGKIAFQTCFRQARIPIVYLIKLAEQDYPTEMGITSFYDAVDHWLLVECLGAIGSYSMG